MQAGTLSHNQSKSAGKFLQQQSGAPGVAQNTLLQQALSEENLNTALQWLRQSCRKQEHSDIWHYWRNWTSHKVTLRQRLKNNTFLFQTVRDAKIINEQGRPENRETRCAEDRLLIRALAQVLKPVIKTSTLIEWAHLAGRGGLNGAVYDIHQHLNQHTNAFVYKSDIKSYQTSIEHSTLSGLISAYYLMTGWVNICRSRHSILQ